MGEVKILIVEDQFSTAERMKIFLEKKGYKITGIATSRKEALDAMEKEMAGLVLMDIYLNGKIEGIAVAREIKEEYPVSIIYITELKDEEIFKQAKETFPKHYITKPFTDATLLHAIELTIQQAHCIFNSTVDRQFVKTVTDRAFILPVNSYSHKKVLLQDILFVEADKAYSNIYIDSKEPFIQVASSSNKIIQQLAYPALIKVHRKHYVNIQRIDKIQDNIIFVKDYKILLSKKYKNSLFDRLNFVPNHSTFKKEM